MARDRLIKFNTEHLRASQGYLAYCACPHVPTRVRVCVYAYACAYAYACVCVCVYVRVCACMRMRVRVRMRVRLELLEFRTKKTPLERGAIWI